ncbi:MAG: hypothetical protein AAGF12_36970 [Myxococcota bacterium]
MRAVFLIFVLLCACDSERRGEEGSDAGGSADPNALDPVYRSWDANAQFGYALANIQSIDPVTRDPGPCVLDIQLATASAAGALATSDQEGSCVVTDTFDLLGTSGDPMPACAGTVTAAHMGSSRIIVCPDDGQFIDPVGLGCSDLRGTNAVRFVSGPDETAGDVLSSLDVSVRRPMAPDITEPATAGAGSARWPAELTVGWAPTEASGVEILIGRSAGDAPMVRCLVDNSGSFTVPNRLLEPYRAGMAFVEVATINQRRLNVDGFDFRASFRVTNAITLFP